MIVLQKCIYPLQSSSVFLLQTLGSSMNDLTTSLEVTCVMLDWLSVDVRHCCRTDHQMFCMQKDAAALVGMDVSTVGDCPDCPTNIIG